MIRPALQSPVRSGALEAHAAAHRNQRAPASSSAPPAA